MNKLARILQTMAVVLCAQTVLLADDNTQDGLSTTEQGLAIGCGFASNIWANRYVNKQFKHFPKLKAQGWRAVALGTLMTVTMYKGSAICINVARQSVPETEAYINHQLTPPVLFNTAVGAAVAGHTQNLISLGKKRDFAMLASRTVRIVIPHAAGLYLAYQYFVKK